MPTFIRQMRNEESQFNNNPAYTPPPRNISTNNPYFNQQQDSHNIDDDKMMITVNESEILNMNHFYATLIKSARATHATMWLTLAAFIILILIELHRRKTIY